jgi:hypothetical protein
MDMTRKEWIHQECRQETMEELLQFIVSSLREQKKKLLLV